MMNRGSNRLSKQPYREQLHGSFTMAIPVLWITGRQSTNKLLNVTVLPIALSWELPFIRKASAYCDRLLYHFPRFDGWKS